VGGLRVVEVIRKEAWRRSGRHGTHAIRIHEGMNLRNPFIR
jgi:hypothetical protein